MAAIYILAVVAVVVVVVAEVDKQVQLPHTWLRARWQLMKFLQHWTILFALTLVCRLR
jgi:hypothetical protein